MRTKCIVCGEPLLKEPLFVCKNMPANSQELPTFEKLDKDEPIDYKLCQCSGCGLVQFDCEPVPYYLDSTRAGERSDILVKMRREQYSHLIETYNLQGKKILEIGAGKGGFLQTLSELNEYDTKAFGIENNVDFVKEANRLGGITVFQGNPERIEAYKKYAPYDAFCSFAYPARLVNPNTMLQGISRNLVEGGVGLIQVASLEHLMKPGGFYDITVDHIAYYSEDTLRYLLQKNGFDVIEHGEYGQLYIYAIVQKRKPFPLETIWSDVDLLTSGFAKYVCEERSLGRKIAIWCAGHFAFTILSISNQGNNISYIIDNAEFKQNRYSPASHVPIYGPEHYKEEPVDTIIILGPIYVDEIVKEIKIKCSQTVKIMTFGKNGLHTLKE